MRYTAVVLGVLLAPALVLAESPLAESCRPVVQAKGFLAPDGARISLSDLARGRPVAVVVIKGEWCPACRAQLVELSKRISEVNAAGGEVIGLSTEDAGTNRKLARELGLRFDVLGEPEAQLLKRLGYWLPEEGHPMPGLIFLDRCGDVASRFVGRRPGADQTELVIKELRRISRLPSGCGTVT